MKATRDIISIDMPLTEQEFKVIVSGQEIKIIYHSNEFTLSKNILSYLGKLYGTDSVRDIASQLRAASRLDLCYLRFAQIIQLESVIPPEYVKFCPTDVRNFYTRIPEMPEKIDEHYGFGASVHHFKNILIVIGNKVAGVFAKTGSIPIEISEIDNLNWISPKKLRTLNKDAVAVRKNLRKMEIKTNDALNILEWALRHYRINPFKIDIAGDTIKLHKLFHMLRGTKSRIKAPFNSQNGPINNIYALGLLSRKILEKSNGLLQ